MSLSDDQLVEADRRAYRARWKWLAVSGAYGLVIGLTIGIGMHHGILPDSMAKWIKIEPALTVTAIGGVLGLPLIMFVRRAVTPPREARAPRIQRRLIEDHQRRGLIAAGIVAVIMPLEAANVIFLDIYHHGQRPTLDGWFAPIAFAMVAAIGVFTVWRGPSPSDEFSGVQRLKSMRLGFAVGIAGLAAVYFVSLVNPFAARLLAPAAIATAVAVPCLHFLLASRRAGRE